MILSRNLQDMITGVPLDDLSTSLHLVEPNLTYSGPNIIMVTLTEQLIRSPSRHKGNSDQMKLGKGLEWQPRSEQAISSAALEL